MDPFLPQARALVWEKVKTGYFDSGIEMFWLDDTEPNIRTISVRSVATTRSPRGVSQLYDLLRNLSVFRKYLTKHAYARKMWLALNFHTIRNRW